MVFTKRLRDGIRRGRIRCSVRIWTRPHVKAGGRYRMDDGHIVVDSIVPIRLADIKADLARESGFSSVDDLLQTAKHGSGDRVYLIRFHYLAPGAWDVQKGGEAVDEDGNRGRFGPASPSGPRQSTSSRRTFVKTIATAAAVSGGSTGRAQRTGKAIGFDHVALPMKNTDAMVTFYRGLGFQTSETPNAVSVHVGSQMINFHRPTRWQDPAFTLRAPSAKPPCGDLCFVWEGTAAALMAMLDRAGVPVVEGPVDRQGGRRKTGSSVYVRDPDGNLLEFMIYS